MKLIYHIILKDAWRLRKVLSWRLAVLAFKLLIGFLLVGTDWFAGPTYGAVRSWVIALTGIELALVMYATAVLVQEDAVAGTQAFWLTRPIAGWRLLSAKLTGWSVLLAVPAVVLTLPWWWANDFSAAQIERATLELLAVLGICSILAAVVASVTTRVGGFLIGVVVLLLMLFPAARTLAWESRLSSQMGAAISAGFLVGVLALAAAIVLRQYLRLKLAHALDWFVLAVPAIVCLAVSAGVWTEAHYWPSWQERWTEKPTAQTEKVALVFNSAEFEKNASPYYSDLWTYFDVRGLPSGMVAAVENPAIDQMLVWPGGSVHRQSYFDSTTATFGTRAQEVLQARLGIAGQQPDPETRQFWTLKEQESRRRYGSAQTPIRPALETGLEARVSIDPEATKQFTPDQARLRARVNLRILAPEILAEAPFRVGQWRSYRGYGFRRALSVVPANRYEPDQPPLPVVITTSPGFLSQKIFDKPLSVSAAPEWGGPALYVVHRKEGSGLHELASFRTRGLRDSLVIGSVQIGWSYARELLARRRGDRWVLRDEAWLDEAEFVLVRPREEARITREVTVAKLEPLR